MNKRFIEQSKIKNFIIHLWFGFWFESSNGSTFWRRVIAHVVSVGIPSVVVVSWKGRSGTIAFGVESSVRELEGVATGGSLMNSCK